MRWWDGIVPPEDDDFSCEEEGCWIGGPDVDSLANSVVAWTSFEPHPEAPPITTSMHSFDAANGTENLSRAARGIPENVIAANLEFYRMISKMGHQEVGAKRKAIWAKLVKKHKLTKVGEPA
jgi:hypothetical protein